MAQKIDDLWRVVDYPDAAEEIARESGWISLAEAQPEIDAEEAAAEAARAAAAEAAQKQSKSAPQAADVEEN